MDTDFWRKNKNYFNIASLEFKTFDGCLMYWVPQQVLYENNKIRILNFFLLNYYKTLLGHPDSGS